jgi:hypothetical protein
VNYLNAIAEEDGLITLSLATDTTVEPNVEYIIASNDKNKKRLVVVNYK